MKINLLGVLENPIFTKWRWFFAIAIFVFIISPVLGPQVNEFYNNLRHQDRIDRIEEETFIKEQYRELKLEIGQLNLKIVTLTEQITILSYERRRDKAAFLTSPVAIWTLDWNGSVTKVDDFNPSFERLVLMPEGIDPNYVKGNTWFDLFSEEQAEMYNKDDLEVVILGKISITNTLYTKKKNGDKQYWQVTKWPIILDSKIVGLRGIAVPIIK
jgi:hypothetical protein